MHYWCVVCFLWSLTSFLETLGQTVPTGCIHYTNFDFFECDLSIGSIPLITDFPYEIANILILKNVASIGGGDFSTYGQSNQSAVSSYTDLDITCAPNSVLTLTAMTFTGCEIYNAVHLRDCNIPLLPAGVFAPFQKLEGIYIEGGNIDSVDKDAFKGFTLVDQGHVGSASINISSTLKVALPETIFSPVASTLRQIEITDSGITFDLAGVLSYAKNVRRINLSRNPFVTLPDNLFDSLKMLQHVFLQDINWECTCPSNTWLLNWQDKKHTQIIGDLVCASGQGKGLRLSKYKKTFCDVSSAAFEGSDFSLRQILTWLFLAIVLALSIAAIILAEKARNFKAKSHKKKKPKQAFQATKQPGVAPQKKEPRKRLQSEKEGERASSTITPAAIQLDSVQSRAAETIDAAEPSHIRTSRNATRWP